MVKEIDDSKKYFYCNNGKVAKNLKELMIILENYPEKDFTRHLNQNKNDFANWIKDVFEEDKLARRISWAQTKEEIIDELNYFLKFGETINEKPSPESKTKKEKPKEEKKEAKETKPQEKPEEKTEDELIKEDLDNIIRNIKEKTNIYKNDLNDPDKYEELVDFFNSIIQDFRQIISRYNKINKDTTIPRIIMGNIKSKIKWALCDHKPEEINKIKQMLLNIGEELKEVGEHKVLDIKEEINEMLKKEGITIVH